MARETAIENAAGRPRGGMNMEPKSDGSAFILGHLAVNEPSTIP
jgi:hypothetical protein